MYKTEMWRLSDRLPGTPVYPPVQRESFIESPAEGRCRLRRSKLAPARCPDGEAIERPLVENVSAEDKHCAIYRDIVARMNLVGNIQVVSKSRIAVKSVEISDLSIDIELQKEGHLGVFGSLPDYHSIFVTIVVRRWCSERTPSCSEVLANCVSGWVFDAAFAAGGWEDSRPTIAGSPSNRSWSLSILSTNAFSCSRTAAFSVRRFSISCSTLGDDDDGAATRAQEPRRIQITSMSPERR